MDTLWVMPGAEGEFGQVDLESETKIGFRMEMFAGMNTFDYIFCTLIIKMSLKIVLKC